MRTQIVAKVTSMRWLVYTFICHAFFPRCRYVWFCMFHIKFEGSRKKINFG